MVSWAAELRISSAAALAEAEAPDTDAANSFDLESESFLTGWSSAAGGAAFATAEVSDTTGAADDVMGETSCRGGESASGYDLDSSAACSIGSSSGTTAGESLVRRRSEKEGEEASADRENEEPRMSARAGGPGREPEDDGDGRTACSKSPTILADFFLVFLGSITAGAGAGAGGFN